MSFLNPAFLSALALVGIPLLIHLIRRRKLKVVRWAAMDFLRQSQRKQRRKLRIEELILLALRMLIVILAVLAFARPVLRALGIPLLSQNARVYAVIVLDNSYSMDFKSPDGKRSFDRAQEAADTVLSRILRDGDATSLVLLSDKPEATVNAPSYDRELVRRRVHAAAVGDRATDYFATAQAVDRLLKASKNPLKEVYWITDDQAGAWAGSGRDSVRRVWKEVGQQARLTWMSVGPPAGSRDNLTVETPALSRELVTPFLPVRIESRIVNHGAKPHPNMLVHLSVDGKPAGSVQVTADANSAMTARFPPYTFTQAGIHVGQIALADAANADGLERDNAASFVINCRERIKVLIQDVHPTADPSKSEAFYLMNAMAPGGAAESLAPKLREGDSLSGVNLRDFDAIVIAGATRLADADRRALAEYVQAGGGLLLFPGPNTEAKSLNDDLDAAGLLAARLGTKRTLSDEEAVTLNPATATHPALTMFKDTETLNLSSARFTTYYRLEPVSDPTDLNSTRVMLRFSAGDPAFVERKVKLGRMILAASSASATWNQLPLKPSYVPMIYQLLSYLGQGPTTRRNLQMDEPLFLALPLTDANRSVQVTTPDGRKSAQNSKLDARGVTFSYTGTQQAGVYHVAVSDSKTEDAFAVGLPAAEGDLAPADPRASVTQAGLPESSLTIANTPRQLEEAVRRSRYGAEIWRWPIWAALVLLGLESLLAQRWGRRG